ncbi:MAG: IPT/TIG domain-containing protein [Chloroflexota bacterium]
MAIAIILGLMVLGILPKTAVSAQAPAFAPPQNITAQITPTATSTPLPPIVITAIEPGQMNSEEGGTLTVFGGGFTEFSVIRVVGIGVIPTTFLNNEVLVGQVPPNVPPGQYNIQVGLGNQDGPNAVVDGVLTIFGPTATPVPSATPDNTFVFGQPQLAIETVVIEPSVPQPGEPFNVTMVLANLGNWTAVDIELALQSTDIAVPAQGSNVRIIPRIQYESAMTLTLPMVLGENALSGPQSLNFNLTYFDINGRSYDTPQSVGLNVSTATATPTPAPSQPRLVLTTYQVEPEAELKPGDIFELVLNITNVGSADSSNVVVTLGGANGEALTPFALLNSGNIRFVDGVESGATVELRQTLLVAGTAASGIFNLPIEFQYDGEDGNPQVENQVINLLVEKPPQFQVNYYRPVNRGFVGEPLDLPIEVVNIGRSLINVSTIAVTSPEMQMENNTVFIGPLDGGTSGSLDALAFPESGGTLDVLVTVNYLDDFNQAQIYEETLTVEVDAPEAPEISEDGEVIEFGELPSPEDEVVEERPFFLRLLMGLLGLGS